MHLEGSLPNKTRGTGMLFGADVCRDFLRRCGLSLVVRSHEQVGGGFEWPFGSGEAALTVFSASDYAGKAKNRGAYALLGAPGSTLTDEEVAAGAAEGTALHFPFGTLRLVQFRSARVELPILQPTRFR